MAFSRERAQRADRKGRIYWAGLLSVSSSMLGLHQVWLRLDGTCMA